MSVKYHPSEYVTVPKGWDCKRLADCTQDEVISYGIVQPGQHDENGVPVIRVNNINNDQLDLSDVLKVSPEIEEKYKRTRLQGGEVLLTLVGSTGQSFVAPEELAGWNVPRAIAVIRANEEIGADWINICLQSKETMHFLNVRANTTVQKTLNLKDVRDIPILIPSPRVKKSIENIALSLSEKIQLNHQINQTLEQIAQALFKSWFVDFDPVKAKIEVLEAGGSDEEALLAAMQVISSKNAEELAAFEVEKPEEYAELRATAALFPVVMVESELGEIPEGWEVGTLADVADLNKNSWTKRGLPVEIEYVDLANTKNGIIESTTPYLSDEAPSRARRKLLDGDSIIGTVRPGNRSFAFIKKPSDILTGSTGFAVLSPKKKTYAEFIYIAATSEEAISRLAHLADGGAYPAVRPYVVSGLVTVIPEEAVLDYFHSLVSPFFELSERFNTESLTLKKLRDTLLPKLLSGEIAFTETLLNERGFLNV